MITFVGIIGKRDKPLYLKTFEEDSSYTEAQLVENAFLALDIFEERVRRSTGAGGNTSTPSALSTTTHRQDFYFGVLSVLTNAVLYGFMSNTQIKFIIAVEEKLSTQQEYGQNPQGQQLLPGVTTGATSEAMVRGTLARIHAEYTKAAMNPFHLLRVEDNEPINSKRMDRAISHIVAAWPKPTASRLKTVAPL
ncbi:hypothetical protein PYCC9005_003065 [Savitreella phatthalungensis]